MSRYTWEKEELLDHADYLREQIDGIDWKLSAEEAERYAKRVQATERVVAEWVKRSCTRERWIAVVDLIRTHIVVGDLRAATMAAQSFENERNLIARLLTVPAFRAGARAAAGAAKGRSTRQDDTAHRNELIRAYFAEHAITESAAKRFDLSARHVRRIIAAK